MPVTSIIPVTRITPRFGLGSDYWFLISPNFGESGAQVDFFATGFNPYSAFRVSSLALGIDITGHMDVTGQFFMPVTITGPVGRYTFTLNTYLPDGTSYTIKHGYRITREKPEWSFRLDPARGYSGDNIRFIVARFKPYADFRVVCPELHVDVSGRLNWQGTEIFTQDVYGVAGRYSVTVHTTDRDGTSISPGRNFTLIHNPDRPTVPPGFPNPVPEPGPEPPPEPGTPGSFSLWPRNGPAGIEITFTGALWEPFTEYLVEGPYGLGIYHRGTMDSRGTFIFDAKLSPFAPSGSYLIVLKGIGVDGITHEVRRRFSVDPRRHPDPLPPVREQLDSVWNFISGAGARVEPLAEHAVRVYRTGEWLTVFTWHLYSTFIPIDEIGSIFIGEEVWLYATEDCTLVFMEISKPLHKGWNGFTWLRFKPLPPGQPPFDPIPPIDPIPPEEPITPGEPGQPQIIPGMNEMTGVLSMVIMMELMAGMMEGLT